MQKRRESCTEFRVKADSPEADDPYVVLEDLSQNDAARATTQADQLSMTPPAAGDGQVPRSSMQGDDVARRQLQY